MRLFIAIEAPESWRRAASELQAALLEALPSGARDALRPVDPALMHVTLRFLGETAPEALESLEEALSARLPPVDVALSLGSTGTFGPAARTSVAWLGIEGDVVGLRALAGRAEEAVREAGLPGEDRAFSPHLTLARVRRQATPAERRAIADAARTLEGFDPGDTAFRAREVALVRSHLGAPQPRYEVLQRWS